MDEHLREKEFGILDRLTKIGITEKYPELSEQRGHVGKFYFRPPGGESWCDVILRLRSLLEMTTREYAGQRVLVVAGSRKIPGAALLSANAALCAGAGKLTIATAQSVAPGLALLMPEARIIGLPKTPACGPLASGVAQLAPCAVRSSAVLIGPGLLFWAAAALMGLAGRLHLSVGDAHEHTQEALWHSHPHRHHHQEEAMRC